MMFPGVTSMAAQVWYSLAYNISRLRLPLPSGNYPLPRTHHLRHHHSMGHPNRQTPPLSRYSRLPRTLHRHSHGPLKSINPPQSPQSLQFHRNRLAHGASPCQLPQNLSLLHGRNLGLRRRQPLLQWSPWISWSSYAGNLHGY